MATGRKLACVICGCLLAVGLPVNAQSAPTSAGAERAAASGSSADYAELIALALREFDAGHWEEARAMFERAHALNPNARTLRGLGVTAFELRRYVQAAKELQASLDDTHNPLTPELRREVELALARAKTFIGTLKVDVKPHDARILVDGAEIRARELVLEVGDYELRISAAGYREARLRITIEGGEKRPVSLALVRIPLEPDPSGLPGRRDGRLTADDSDNLLTSVWFWTASAAVVAGVVVGAVLIANDEPTDPRERGDVGGVVNVLRIAP